MDQELGIDLTETIKNANNMSTDDLSNIVKNLEEQYNYNKNKGEYTPANKIIKKIQDEQSMLIQNIIDRENEIKDMIILPFQKASENNNIFKSDPTYNDIINKYNSSEIGYSATPYSVEKEVETPNAITTFSQSLTINDPEKCTVADISDLYSQNAAKITATSKTSIGNSSVSIIANAGEGSAEVGIDSNGVAVTIVVDKNTAKTGSLGTKFSITSGNEVCSLTTAAQINPKNQNKPLPVGVPVQEANEKTWWDENGDKVMIGGLALGIGVCVGVAVAEPTPFGEIAASGVVPAMVEKMRQIMEQGTATSPIY